MKVMALLPPVLLTHARAALAPRHRILTVRTLTDADRMLRDADPDVILIDPLAAGRGSIAMTMEHWQQAYGTPVVIYTTVSPRAMRGLLDLGQAGIRALVLAGYDDQPDRLCALVDAQPSLLFSQQFLARLDGALRRLPRPLAHAVTWLFRTPHDVHSTTHLARAVGMEPRSVERWTRRVGLATPSLLVAVARVVRACYFLRASTVSMFDAAQRVGYRTPRSLTIRLLATTGLSLRRVRRVPTRELFDRVERHLRRG